MAINKLANTVRVPLKYTAGSFKERQIKANNLTEEFYRLFEKEIKDNYTIFSFSNILDKMQKIAPDKKLMFNIKTVRGNKYGAYTEYLYDKKKDIIGVSMDLPGISRSIRPAYLSYLIHEFQHVSDQIFHPKYIARAQSLSHKRLLNKKYDRFYDKYYYCVEEYHTEKQKQDILENVKIRTLNFIKKQNTESKLDFLQDMRYSLESEIQAYAKENETAKRLKDKGLTIIKDSLCDMPKHCMFKEKTDLLKEIIAEIIKTERTAHAQRLEQNI